MGVTNRRSFLVTLAAGFALDPERLLWTPGKKTISIPKPRITSNTYALYSDTKRWYYATVYKEYPIGCKPDYEGRISFTDFYYAINNPPTEKFPMYHLLHPSTDESRVELVVALGGGPYDIGD
jgi:hypothetical protein